MELIKLENNEIKLCSGLTENAFAKTKFSLLITQTGILATAELSGSSDSTPVFNFAPWQFDSIKSLDDSEKAEPVVWFCGTLPENLKNPSVLAENCSYENAFLFCTAISQAWKDGIALPQTGGTVIISKTETKASVLFLPQEIFYNSVSAFDSNVFSKYLGFWFNPQLEGELSFSYTQSVTAYRTLSGQFPFSNINEEERMADISDNNFLPAEYAVNGINPQLALFINRCFKSSKNSPVISAKDFPLKLFEESHNIPQNQKLSDEDFAKRVEDFKKNQSSKISKKRTIHKNSAKIIAAGIAAAFICCFLASTIKAHGEQPTSKGKTASETVELFFQSVNQKNVQLMMNVTKGAAFKPYINAATALTVANAASQAYTLENTSVQPQTWFFYAVNPELEKRTGIYGISNLKIDGKTALFDAVPVKRNEKIDFVREEKGITLEEGSKSVKEIEFYVIETDGETNRLVIEKAQGTVTLTYIKKCWLLTDIKTTSKTSDFDTEKFKEDYLKAVEKNNKNAILAADSIRNNYPWIPLRQILEVEKEKLPAGF